jgi:hypothetical protein
MTRKPKLTSVERLLEKVRKNPSPTIRSQGQSDLLELLKADRAMRTAFSHLDEAIRRKIEDEDGAA